MTELLFDNLWLDRCCGVRRVLGTPQKELAPVLQAEAPWETQLHAHHALFYDTEEHRFKLWYRASAGLGTAMRGDNKASEPTSDPHRNFLCYAESANGVQWTRPALGLFELQGRRENNILREIGEGDSVFWNVIKDPNDPDPSRRYKALGFDWAATSDLAGCPPGTRGVCVAYSSDGLHWPKGPRLVMSTHDITDADCLLPQREPTTGRWVAFLRPRTHPKRRFIGYAESRDFDHRTYPRMLLTPDAHDDEWSEFYGLTAAVVGKWRVGVLWVFHNNPECSPMTTELVYSRDGLHYRRALPGAQFLPLGPEGTFDSRMVLPVALLAHGNEFLLYYTGCNHEHGADRGQPMPPGRVAPGEERRSALGLAHLRGMNFCGLRTDHDGMVETKWLCNYGECGIRAFATADADGWLRAEILDQYGGVIPGWDRDACRADIGADGRVRLCWGRQELIGRYGQTSAAGGNIGHVVKVRFYLHRATLFGFQVGDEDGAPPAG